MDDYFATVHTAPQSAYPSTSWTPTPPPPPKKRSGFNMGHVKILVTFLLALWGARWAYYSADFFVKAGTPLHTPAQIGSAPRLDTAEARQFEKGVANDYQSFQKPQAALYGTTSSPEYVLFAGFTAEDSGADMLGSIRESAREDGDTVGKPVRRNGLTCATYSTIDFNGAVCAWAGTRSNGFVMAFENSNLTELAKLTATARTEVDA